MISEYYRAVLQDTHRTYPKWGTSARKHIGDVIKFIEEHEVKTILDYGCGKGEFKKALDRRLPGHTLEVHEYDPGIVGKEEITKEKFDLVVCLDVMEHVEPDELGSVMMHLKSLVGDAGYFLISTKKAIGMLTDGRNAHLIVEDFGFWMDVFCEHFGACEVQYNAERHELIIQVKN